MRIGVADTHGIAVRRGIPDGRRAGCDFFGGPIRNLAAGTCTNSARRLSEAVNAQASALGSTKGAT
ncbi:hypothetical protein HAP47_0016255 [Bradyrhizobium sp. 41S5]|uniref:hypothetical protein n=1 Tax=Bradyrhizobium sp. 41S5 TaxID=1404443 RepID=UPI00156AA7BC|nr:hypothetical protein [Bradyrhizobium sp. 41S5]UFX48130.1 hypothetical protein HAP47_0016255 [Bradyrhizobium sp. 41S5]